MRMPFFFAPTRMGSHLSYLTTLNLPILLIANYLYYSREGFTLEIRFTKIWTHNTQYKWSENSAWYQDASRRAGILVSNPDLGVGDFLETDAGFVWVEVAGVRVYSCYLSPGDPFDVFETQIFLLEESLREAIG